MIKVTKKLLGVLAVGSLAPLVVQAQVFAQQEGLGDHYNDLLYLIHGILAKICVITGGVLILGGLAQYKSHRDNPMAVKLGVPISMVIIGLLLIGLAYLPSPIKEAVTS